jgi:hypothetical protein
VIHVRYRSKKKEIETNPSIQVYKMQNKI